MAARYVFRDEYEPVFGRATDKNSSIDDTGEEKQHIWFSLQKIHHNLRGLIYCAIVWSDRDASVASNTV